MFRPAFRFQAFLVALLLAWMTSSPVLAERRPARRQVASAVRQRAHATVRRAVRSTPALPVFSSRSHSSSEGAHIDALAGGERRAASAIDAPSLAPRAARRSSARRRSDSSRARSRRIEPESLELAHAPLGAPVPATTSTAPASPASQPWTASRVARIVETARRFGLEPSERITEIIANAGPLRDIAVETTRIGWRNARRSLARFATPDGLADWAHEAFTVRVAQWRGVPVGPTIGTPEFEARMDEVTGTRATDGNRIKLLIGGRAIAEANTRLLREAGALPVYRQTFVAGDDATGRAQGDLMIEGARLGPRRFLIDAKGSEESSPAFFERLVEGGVAVRIFGPPEERKRLNFRSHRKALIVGNRVAITGDANVRDEYAGVPWTKKGSDVLQAPWHSVDVEVEGPAVLDLTREFIRDYEALGEPIPESEKALMLSPPNPISADEGGGLRVRVIPHRPYEDGDRNTLESDILKIRGARSRILYINPYFSPPPRIIRELRAAAKRGVKIETVTSSVIGIDVKFCYDAMRLRYRPLVKAGVRIFERSPMPHAKVIIVDDQYVQVGSVNQNGRSNHRDDETALEFRSRELATEAIADFEQRRSESREISKNELDVSWGEWIRLQLIGLIAPNL